MTQIICGVDIASSSLQARIGPDGAEGSFPNTPDGIALLAGFCRHHGVTLVAMEATGGYERQAFALLAGEELDVVVLNPRAVRQFASGMGRLEKTDRIDAGMIAWYAEVKRPTPTAPSPESHRQLRALVTRLRQLTALRTAQLNQRRLVQDPGVQAGFTDLLAMINAQIRQLSDHIAALIGADPLWKQLDAAFRSLRGWPTEPSPA